MSTDVASTRLADYSPSSPPPHAPLQALDQALVLLEYLADCREWQTVTGISRHFGWTKPKVHRLLSTLRSRGYVAHEPAQGSYRFGVMTSNLARQANMATCLSQTIWPAVKGLSRATGETVVLAILDDDKTIVVEVVKGAQSVRASELVGRLMPVHCSSAGIALLSYLSDEDIMRLLPSKLQSFTPYTPSTPAAVVAAAHAARNSGCAIEREWVNEGLSSVSVPIRGAEDTRPEAALTLCVPSDRFDRNVSLLCRAAVSAGARASAELSKEYSPSQITLGEFSLPSQNGESDA